MANQSCVIMTMNPLRLDLQFNRFSDDFLSVPSLSDDVMYLDDSSSNMTLSGDATSLDDDDWFHSYSDDTFSSFNDSSSPALLLVSQTPKENDVADLESPELSSLISISPSPIQTQSIDSESSLIIASETADSVDKSPPVSLSYSSNSIVNVGADRVLSVADDHSGGCGSSRHRMVNLNGSSCILVEIKYGVYINRDFVEIKYGVYKEKNQGGDSDEDEDDDDDDDDYDHLDDELVPRNLSKKVKRDRMRKLGKRAFAKIRTSKRCPYSHVKPGCVYGKYSFGIKFRC